MSRLRWYHFYFLLAAFDVVVILMSLKVHGRTILNVQSLIGAEQRLHDQTNWLELARQRVLELGSPGNDLFRTSNVQVEQKKFRFAESRMREALKEAERRELDVAEFEARVAEMTRAAEEIFGHFEQMSVEDEHERRDLLVKAGKAMATMDDAQIQAQRTLYHMAGPIATERLELLTRHEQDLQLRLNNERYFIAAVVLILGGILFFGRKLQQADRALAAERKRLQEERRERLAAIGELCSSVAHGIRNPLASIRSSAQLTLEMGQLDAESRDRLNDILSEGRRLGDRVTRLLSFARSSAESFEKIELQQLVAAAVGELMPELRRRGLQIVEDFSRRSMWVHGDRHQLQQVVIELVSNAMEHAPSGGVIRVACAPANGDGMAVLSVEDNGPGVPQESRGRIFDLFYTTKPTGTGIGLATVRRIARAHGGDAVLDASSGSGAKFCVRLPSDVRSAGPDTRSAAMSNLGTTHRHGGVIS
jgi:signal transduction histidine kinase